jgi:acetyltransferase
VIQPTNPLDLGDLFNFDLYTNILQQVLKFPVVDGILFMHGATAEEKEPSRRFIQAVKDLSIQYQKPVALQYNTDEEELAYIKRALDYPIFAEPEDALMALAVSRDHYKKLNILKEKPTSFPVRRDRVEHLFQKARAEARDLLLPEAFEVLQAYGIPVADYQVVRKKENLKKSMKELEGPVALKVISPGISHKSDAGGVLLNLSQPSEVEQAYEKIRKLDPENSYGVLLQKMIPGGKEVILGTKRDPSFGPVLLFGLGGIYVEILHDTSLRIAPINRFEAEEMISELRTAAILKGIRGEPPSDRDSLIENLLRLSQLVIDFPEIEGIDINPVKVLEKGAVAVDARILLKDAKGMAQSA